MRARHTTQMTYAYIVAFNNASREPFFRNDFVQAINEDDAYTAGMRTFDDTWTKEARKDDATACPINNLVIPLPGFVPPTNPKGEPVDVSGEPVRKP